MGCPTSVHIGEDLIFSITTHDADTGVLTDADSNPTYRIYENETGVPILTGTMAKLDDGNTTGFYTESVACTGANGFEVGKDYTIYIEATVNGNKGGIPYTFRAIAQEGIKKNAALNNFEFLMVDSADHITPKTGLTIASTRSIDGAAFASTTNTATEISGGWYKINLSADDLNGDVISFVFGSSGADNRVITIKTAS